MLIALWLRSYSYYDSCDLHSGRSIMLRLISRKGVVLIAPWVIDDSGSQSTVDYHGISRAQVEAFQARTLRPPYEFPPWKIAKHNYPTGSVEYDLFLPHWFLAVASTSLASVPWIAWPRRFSLRTLLVATTLVAVILASVVIAAR
jgi:hypothetical protein